LKISLKEDNLWQEEGLFLKGKSFLKLGKYGNNCLKNLWKITTNYSLRKKEDHSSKGLTKMKKLDYYGIQKRK